MLEILATTNVWLKKQIGISVLQKKQIAFKNGLLWLYKGFLNFKVLILAKFWDISHVKTKVSNQCGLHQIKIEDFCWTKLACSLFEMSSIWYNSLSNVKICNNFLKQNHYLPWHEIVTGFDLKLLQIHLNLVTNQILLS